MNQKKRFASSDFSKLDFFSDMIDMAFKITNIREFRKNLLHKGRNYTGPNHCFLWCRFVKHLVQRKKRGTHEEKAS